MKKTLQDQYLLIKEGKGHKGVFLSEAKTQFPNIVRNAATFEEAVASLKTKSIISENIISVMPVNSFEHAKKESYELAFENFLKEAKKKTQEEPEKAEASKPSKQVEKDLEHNFDRKDDKNPDNLIFDQIMMGYYAELKDPKNSEKTMQELKDIVFKNLAKDPIHYTKDGQFGTKGLGYTTEAPGLGTPKEAKGKYKASGYGDLKEGMFSSKPMSDKDPKTPEIGKEVKYRGTSYTVKDIDAVGNLVLVDKNEKEINVNKAQFNQYGTLEENILRKAIRNIINEELANLNKETLLKESVEKDLADINKEAEHEVLQSKLDKIDALIDHRRSKLGKLDEDEDMKALTDKKKVKELEKDIKKLEVARKKIEKMLHKTKGKKKEVIDETEDEEVDPTLYNEMDNEFENEY